MDKKKLIYTTGSVGIVLLLLYGLYLLLGVGLDPKIIESLTAKVPSRTTWSQDSKHTLTVFSDYQCPACKSFHELLTSFESTSSANYFLTKKTSLVFRYYPLYTIHTHANTLAYAAESAGKQGKFWEMSKELFSKQNEVESQTNIDQFIANIASSLKLDVVQLKKDMQSPTVQEAVKSDMGLGDKALVNATPTFFLDGKKLEIGSPDNLIQILKDIQ